MVPCSATAAAPFSVCAVCWAGERVTGSCVLLNWRDLSIVRHLLCLFVLIGT